MIKFPWFTGKKSAPVAGKAPAPSPPPENTPGQETLEHRDLVRQALETRRAKAHVFDRRSSPSRFS